MSAHAELRKRRADEILNRDYLGLRPAVLGAVAGWLRRNAIFFDASDLEAHYNTAWQGYYNELRAGRTVEKPQAFLFTIVRRRAIDDARRLHSRGRAVTYEVIEEVAAVGADADVAARLDDHTKLKQFMEGLKDRLSQRELEAAALCYIHGYSRPDAAKVLGVEPKRMEKIMDAVSKKVGAFVRDIEAGAWCESRRSLMNAYAFGVLDKDGSRHRQAVGHLEGCPACRRYVRAAQGLAAIVPPVALPIGPLAPHGEMAGDLLDRIHGLLHHSAKLADGAKTAATGGLGSGGLVAKAAAALGAAALAGGGAAAATGAIELSARADGSATASTRTVAARSPAPPAGVKGISVTREPRAGALLAARPVAQTTAPRTKKTRRTARAAKRAIRRASATSSATRIAPPSTTPTTPTTTTQAPPPPTPAPRRTTSSGSTGSGPSGEFSVEG